MPAQGPPGYGVPQPGWGTPPPEPREVTTSFWLWIAAVVVGLIGAVVSFLQVGSVTDQIDGGAAAGAGSGLDPGTLSSIVTASLVVGAVLGLVLVALEVLFAVFMRRGRNWARIVLAVFGIIGVLFTLGGLFSASTTVIGGQEIVTRSGISTVLSVVQALLVVAAVVMFFRPPANAYFRARR